MKFTEVEGFYTPKNCKFGPRRNVGVILEYPECRRVFDYLTRTKRLQENFEMKKKREEDKLLMSKEMSKLWDNSIVNKSQTLEREKLQMKEDRQREEKNKYDEIMKARKERQKVIFLKTREIIRKRRPIYETLNIAIRQSEVEKVRRKQIAFDQSVRDKEMKEEKEFSARRIADAEEFLKEEKEKLIQMKINRNKYGDELRKFFAEKATTEKLEKEKRIEEERKSLKMMKDEIIKLENYEKEKKRLFTLSVSKYLEDFKQKKERDQETSEIEELREEKINQIYNKYARELKMRRIKLEEKNRREVIEEREKANVFLSQKMAANEKEEEERLEAARLEKEKEEMEKEMAKQKFKEGLLKEILEVQEQAKLDGEEKRRNMLENTKWIKIQGQKKNEIDEAWIQKGKDMKKEKIKDIRENLAKLVTEKELIKQEQMEEFLRLQKFSRTNMEVEDEQFLEYADEVLEESKLKNRSLYPMLTCIEKFKKEAGIKSKTEVSADIPKQVEKRSSGKRFMNCYCFK